MRWLLLLFMLLTAVVSAQDWQVFSFAEDGFSISAPKAFEVEKSASPSGLQSHYYSLDRGHNSGWMVVTTQRSPQDKRPSQRVLEEASEGGARAINGRIVSSQAIKAGTCPGLEARVEAKGFDITVRYFVTDARIYQLIATAGKGSPIADTERFFSSFQVLEP